MDVFDRLSDICLLTKIYVAFSPVGIWLVYIRATWQLHISLFWLFQRLFWWTVCFWFFFLALLLVWEERNICISSPKVVMLFQGFNPSDRYFACLVIQTDMDMAWVAMDSIKLYFRRESKSNFVCQCTSASVYLQPASGWWGGGRWVDALAFVTHDGA